LKSNNKSSFSLKGQILSSETKKLIAETDLTYDILPLEEVIKGR